MTTLVTGGNGWVPSFIVRRLARRGETVISYDVMKPDDLLLDFLGADRGQVVFVDGDVTDRERLREVAHDHKVTRIVHAAAITPRLDQERREPQRIIDVNLGGTVAALDVASDLPGFARFVYVSSCAVWGAVPGATVLTEDTPSHATSLYGVTKYTSERVCQRYATLYGLDIVSMRPANVYGPMERVTPGYVGATELREMLRLHYSGQPILLNSLAGPYLDWTYVEDIAEGIERAWATPNLPNDVYSLTCGHLYSIGDVLAAFQHHLSSLVYRVVPLEDANVVVSGDLPGAVPSNARLQQDFGWVPSTPFASGMDKYLTWITANGPQ